MFRDYRYPVSRSTVICNDTSERLYDTRGMDAARHRQLVGRRIKTAIQALGITQAAVGRDLDTSTQKLNNWIRGDNYPDPLWIARFCDRYGITTDHLYRGVIPGISGQALAGALFAAEEAERAASPEAADQARETP